MKTKRFIALMISLIMVLSMLPLTALAVTPTDKVSEVELTLPEPRAGETVNLSFSSVCTNEALLPYRSYGAWLQQKKN